MRIVLVNWARIWDGASYGGGVNQYCQALAIELVKRGHDVISLFGGTSFMPVPTTDCFIRRHDDWMGVRVFEVINSPVLAPGIRQFSEPLGELSAPALEDQVGRLMAALKPDAVHWNNIEGFSAHCIKKIREVVPHARQIFSLHNYHTICPQVYLMQGHRRTCYDSDNGHNCEKCIEHEPVDKLLREMQLAWQKDWQKNVDEESRTWRDAAANLKRVFVGPLRISAAKRKPRGEVPGAPVPLGGGSGSVGAIDGPQLPAGGAESDKRGKTPHLLAELRPWTPPPSDAPELQPLSNDVRPEPVSNRPLSAYGQRRAAMVQMLNGCDQVLAVSDFVRRKFVSMGVREEVISAMPIGSRINRVIALRPDLLFDPPRFGARRNEPLPEPWENTRPLRLHFMGYNNYYKGLHVLAEALEMLRPAHARKIDLSIFALDGQSIEWLFRRLEPRLAGLKFSYAYNYHDIPWMLGGKDLTVVPSVWWDNAPQTVFESLSCGVPVLGANIGGIPDFVQHRVNGLLFTANSRPSLRDTLISAIEDPWMVEGLRANVRPSRGIEEHAIDMERVFAGPSAR
jgi:glycosyltransferase involved in cell wall biosynthesis